MRKVKVFPYSFIRGISIRLNEWVRKEGGALQQDLIGRYKEKIAGFSTLLEDIELPK